MVDLLVQSFAEQAGLVLISTLYKCFFSPWVSDSRINLEPVDLKNHQVSAHSDRNKISLSYAACGDNRLIWALPGTKEGLADIV